MSAVGVGALVAHESYAADQARIAEISKEQEAIDKSAHAVLAAATEAIDDKNVDYGSAGRVVGVQAKSDGNFSPDDRTGSQAGLMYVLDTKAGQLEASAYATSYDERGRKNASDVTVRYAVSEEAIEACMADGVITKEELRGMVPGDARPTKITTSNRDSIGDDDYHVTQLSLGPDGTLYNSFYPRAAVDTSMTVSTIDSNLANAQSVK